MIWAPFCVLAGSLEAGLPVVGRDKTSNAFWFVMLPSLSVSDTPLFMRDFAALDREASLAFSAPECAVLAEMHY